MRRITIFEREDLSEKCKLIETNEVSIENFKYICREQVPISDIVLFQCSLTNELKILKSRQSGQADIDKIKLSDSSSIKDIGSFILDVNTT